MTGKSDPLRVAAAIILGIITGGILFLVVGISAYLNSFYLRDPNITFWFCYLALVLIGIGFLMKRSEIVAAQINILLIPAIFWIVDFFFVLFGGNLFGLTNYFFEIPMASRIISSQHLFTIPLAIFGVYLLKLKINDFWKISFIEVILIFVVTRIFTDSSVNINEVFYSPFGFQISFIPYFVQWFVVVFAMIFVVNYFLVKVFWNKK